MEIEASLWQISLSTKLEEILDLKIFSESFRGPHVARGPLIAHPWFSVFAQLAHLLFGSIG